MHCRGKGTHRWNGIMKAGGGSDGIHEDKRFDLI